MELNREMFEPAIEEVLEINDLEVEVVLSFLTEKGRRQIQTCPGDIYKIVNMLMDYARMLEGFHRATYELHAEQCRTIAKKYAAGIGYDYEKAVARCRKRREKRDDGVGEDALVLAMRKRSGEPEAGQEGEPEATVGKDGR